jgi:hypothetical protein
MQTTDPSTELQDTQAALREAEGEIWRLQQLLQQKTSTLPPKRSESREAFFARGKALPKEERAAATAAYRRQCKEDDARYEEAVQRITLEQKRTPLAPLERRLDRLEEVVRTILKLMVSE